MYFINPNLYVIISPPGEKCGLVKFKVTTVIDKVVACNCSICTKKGVLHHRVAPEKFNLVEGKQFLTLYQFDTKEAKHYFCGACGIHHVYQAYRLAHGTGTEQDARVILDDALARLQRLPPAEAQRLVETLAQRYAPNA